MTLVAFLCACSDDPSGTRDAAVPAVSDAAVLDGAATDAPITDAAVRDAAVADVSRLDDAPGVDAAVPVPIDAAVPVDGALPIDAAAPIDASTPHPDASTIPPGLVCDPVHQVGCGVGQKCDLAANGNFACVPDGALGDFRVCNPMLPNACAAGFTCRGTFFGDHRCARMCLPAEGQCRVDEPCNSIRTTTDGHQYRMCATNQQCNPILDDCSDPTKHCTWNLGGFCMTPGNVADGGSCQSSASCRQGSACLKVGLGSVFKCFKLCDPSGGAPSCATGVTCTQFSTVGPQDVGACGFIP